MRVFSDMDQAIPKLNTVLKKRRQQAEKVAGLVMIKLNTRKRYGGFGGILARVWGLTCTWHERLLVGIWVLVGVPRVHIGAFVLRTLLKGQSKGDVEERGLNKGFLIRILKMMTRWVQ